MIIRELKRLKISKSLRKFPSMTESLYGVGTDSDPLLLFLDLSTDKQLLGKVSFTSRYMLWFNFILGSNLIFLCFKLIIIHYNTQKQKKKKLIKDKIEPQHTHAGGIQDGNWSLTLYFLQKTKGGVLLPEKGQGKVLEGTVVAAGPGNWDHKVKAFSLLTKWNKSSQLVNYCFWNREIVIIVCST